MILYIHSPGVYLFICKLASFKQRLAYKEEDKIFMIIIRSSGCSSKTKKSEIQNVLKQQNVYSTSVMLILLSGSAFSLSVKGMP